ncbi:15200_t:CDS:2, partial [Racocetra fulgida]
MTHAMATFMAFYHANKIEDWTCNNLVGYYRDKTEKKDWKKVLDWIKKDLIRVTSTISQLNNLTGDSTQNFDNCRITSGKRDREETERASPRLKKSDNDESQELCDSDSDPISDHKLPDELSEFVSIKIPTTFDDMEEFAKSMPTLMDFQVDVLRTVKLINKKPIEDQKVYKSEVKNTPQKDREKKKATNNTLPSYPESPCPGSP